MTGGPSFQTKDSWIGFIDKKEDDIAYLRNDAEIYFETDDLDSFLELLESKNNIQYVHGLKTYDWDQRGIRIYDPDYHIIETLQQICQRFINEDLRLEEMSQKTMLSIKIIERMLKNLNYTKL